MTALGGAIGIPAITLSLASASDFEISRYSPITIVADREQDAEDDAQQRRAAAAAPQHAEPDRHADQPRAARTSRARCLRSRKYQAASETTAAIRPPSSAPKKLGSLATTWPVPRPAAAAPSGTCLGVGALRVAGVADLVADVVQRTAVAAVPDLVHGRHARAAARSQAASATRYGACDELVAPSPGSAVRHPASIVGTLQDRRRRRLGGAGRRTAGTSRGARRPPRRDRAARVDERGASEAADPGQPRPVLVPAVDEDRDLGSRHDVADAGERRAGRRSASASRRAAWRGPRRPGPGTKQIGTGRGARRRRSSRASRSGRRRGRRGGGSRLEVQWRSAAPCSRTLAGMMRIRAPLVVASLVAACGGGAEPSAVADRRPMAGSAVRARSMRDCAEPRGRPAGRRRGATRRAPRSSARPARRRASTR